MPVLKRVQQLSIATAIIATYGVSALPSMAAGTPVVVTNTTPVPTTVGNTTANPVPTKITNTTAVPVAGSVAVTNSTANPVPTVNVNKPAHTPFSKRFDVTFSSGSGSATFTVPAGKLLVITYVSCDVGTTPGAHILVDLATYLNGAEVESHLPAYDQGVLLGQEVFTESEKMTVYADPNSTVTIAFLDSDSAHSGGSIVGIYGYLVDATAASFE
jgi:hypothetical protein